jgi:hypothetical protein
MVTSLVGLCLGTAACAGAPPPTTASTTTTSGDTGTTTSSSTAPVASRFNVGITKFDWFDASRATVNGAEEGQPIPGRQLETEILYPTLKGSPGNEIPGAVPDTSNGPFPVVAFAHGFDVSPNYYSALLDSWVEAGFIVVAPYFPDESTATISKVGGPDSPVGLVDEEDIVNEPGDIAYVLGQFFSAVAGGEGPLVPGMARTNQVAIAGQSDGANAVAALAFGSAYSSILASMPAPVSAVAILSGEGTIYSGPTAIPGAATTTNSFSSSASSPPVLQVQSRSDSCNPPADAAALFSTLSAAPVHLFETLKHAAHLQPYTDLIPGPNPYLRVVTAVTIDFFKMEMHWRDAGISLSTLEQAASVPKVSSISTTAPAFPTPKGKLDCELPKALAHASS